MSVCARGVKDKDGRLDNCKQEPKVSIWVHYLDGNPNPVEILYCYEHAVESLVADINFIGLPDAQKWDPGDYS
jgi:hypothetical protein